MSLVRLLLVALLIGCGDEPREGDPCGGPERRCGADDFGLSCEGGVWEIRCFDCRELETEIECSIRVCMAVDPSTCGQPSNTRTETFRFAKDGS
jgi:hypothetical protein